MLHALRAELIRQKSEQSLQIGKATPQPCAGVLVTEPPCA
jgi:hypothetical protein